MNGQVKICAWCGANFYADRRHKYCSEECYIEAHREQCRVNFRRRYATKYEQECERHRKRYHDNPEGEKARATAWMQQNPERHCEHSRKWYHAHKEAANNA